MLKRTFDIVVSLLLLILLSPVIVLISIVIKIGSPGCIIFKQERVGVNEKLFPIYKFRSMVSDAERKGEYFTAPGDKRVTAVGRFIRKTSLDELPQLINVIVGDMSLIGPRPDLLIQKENYTDSEWSKRLSIRPGITGLAQATVRSNTTNEERKKLDLEYVESRSFLVDLKILYLTLIQVFFKGSY